MGLISGWTPGKGRNGFFVTDLISMRRLNQWVVWLFPRGKNGQNMDLASYFHPELNSGLFTPSPPRLYKHLRKYAYPGTTIPLELHTLTNSQQVVYQG